MKFTPCRVAGVYVIDLERREDERGFFARTWCARELAAQGLNPGVAQVNVQVSPRAGTLRGLHFQLEPFAEVKIVRCNRGRIFDVAVDLRPSSPTYLGWYGIELRAEEGRMLYVPEGCAHGYLTLEPDTEVMYFTSEFYAPEAARGVRYDDPAFGIEWPAQPVLVSAADRSWPLIGEKQGS
jgi:dTDP-4-dehydrorhamnose 3,5-epimerase